MNKHLQLGWKKKNPNKLQFKGEFRNTDSLSPLSESVCGQRTHEFVINVIEQQLAPIIHWGLILHFLSPQQGHVPSDTRDLVCLFMANEFFFFFSHPSQTFQYTQLTGTHWDVVLTWSIACSNFLIVSSISLFTIFKSK